MCSLLPTVACYLLPGFRNLLPGPRHDAVLQALNFFVQQLNQAAENLDNGVDVNKASASQESADLAANVSSYMGWAMTTIAAATVGVTNTPQATPQSTPQKPGPRPSTTHNGALYWSAQTLVPTVQGCRVCPVSRRPPCDS